MKKKKKKNSVERLTNEVVTRCHFIIGAIIDFSVFGIKIFVGHQSGVFRDVSDTRDATSVIR